LLALGFLTLPGPAFNDFLWSIDAIPFATVLWLPLVFPTMLIMTSILLADDVARVRAALGSMNRVLEERVESARAELARSYEQSRETEREAISAQERLRLVRDMHDGVGTRLTLLLSGLQKGVVSSPEIQQGVEEALEEMRLLIDAQSPNTATVVEAAANLRYRLEPRLAAAGVATVWQVQPAAEMITLPANATLHVLRIILECVSNAVRHGRARNVTLAFALQAEDFDGRRRDALVVSVGDDGAGIVCASPGTRGSGRGLANARARAAAVGGRFEIESCPGGTRACLVVPL
jgi:signal transduction histidine kinase